MLNKLIKRYALWCYFSSFCGWFFIAICAILIYIYVIFSVVYNRESSKETTASPTSNFSSKTARLKTWKKTSTSMDHLDSANSQSNTPNFLSVIQLTCLLYSYYEIHQKTSLRISSKIYTLMPDSGDDPGNEVVSSTAKKEEFILIEYIYIPCISCTKS